MRSLPRGAGLGGLAILALTASLMAGGQDGGRLPLLEPTAGTFKSTVDLVTLNVAVSDGRNRPVPGLGRDDFQVLEDGVAQDLSFFAAADVPIDVMLLIDSSSSMLDKIQLVQQAAEGFIDALRPGDRASITGFATQVRVIQSFTSDHAALKTAVHSIIPKGSTALYTAVYIALDQFQRARREQTVAAGIRRPAIVVLTDGDDTASLLQFDDLLDRARRAWVAVYPISIVVGWDPSGLSQPGGRRFSTVSDYSLKTLAQDTGGRAFFPTQLADLSGVYGLVAEELSAQYAMGYVPKVDRRDGGYRQLSVRVMSRPDARPRTRTGYYSAGPARASR